MEHKKKIRHYILCPITELDVTQKLKYHTVEKIQISNIQIVERAKFGSLTHTYMTAHFSGWVQAP